MGREMLMAVRRRRICSFFLLHVIVSLTTNAILGTYLRYLRHIKRLLVQNVAVVYIAHPLS